MIDENKYGEVYEIYLYIVFTNNNIIFILRLLLIIMQLENDIK